MSRRVPSPISPAVSTLSSGALNHRAPSCGWKAEGAAVAYHAAAAMHGRAAIAVAIHRQLVAHERSRLRDVVFRKIRPPHGVAVLCRSKGSCRSLMTLGSSAAIRGEDV